MSYRIGKAKVRERMSGAGGDGLVDGRALALQVWGRKAEARDSGLLAFAYLYRRFGEPTGQGDPYKEIAEYLLTTPDPDVVLCLCPKGSPLVYAVSYFATEAIQKELRKPAQAWSDLFEAWAEKRLGRVPSDDEMFRLTTDAEFMRAAKKEIGERPRNPDPGDWQHGPAVMQRVNGALVEAMKRLLRPVRVRDVEINLFGHVAVSP